MVRGWTIFNAKTTVQILYGLASAAALDLGSIASLAI
jgi:hypothetical protein